MDGLAQGLDGDCQPRQEHEPERGEGGQDAAGQTDADTTHPGESRHGADSRLGPVDLVADGKGHDAEQEGPEVGFPPIGRGTQPAHPPRAIRQGR